MNVFYNREGIGDTLIVMIKEAEHAAYEKRGTVARIYDEKTKETAGFNIFEASRYGGFEGSGPVKLTEALLDKLNGILAENGFDEKLDADLSPKFVVGYVKEKEKHPDSDHLSICQVDTGAETLQIVCGAPNVEAGQKVVVAKTGAVMPNGMIIKDAVLRGVASSGMICSARELGLPNAPQKKGILVLDGQYEVGSEFPLPK